MYPTISIISFDASPDAAEREQAEDRSLNILMRQSRVRSEMFRLSLTPTDAEVDLLCEILVSTPKRPLVMLTRALHDHDEQELAVKRLAELSPDVRLVHIGPDARELLNMPTVGEQLRIESDDSVQMEALAQTLIDRIETAG